MDNLEEARKFYSGVLGMAEAFATKDPAVAGDLACFKVNDRQYVELSPTLKGETNIALDGRWLLQLYDKNFTRTGMLIRKPVQTPCCSPNLDDFKQ